MRPAVKQEVARYFSGFLQKSEVCLTVALWVKQASRSKVAVRQAFFSLMNASKGKAAVNERCVQEAREAWLSDEDESQ